MKIESKEWDLSVFFRNHKCFFFLLLFPFFFCVVFAIFAPHFQKEVKACLRI